MHAGITVVNEGARGCGFRKVGGMYLVSDGPVSGCGKLPVPLDALNVFECPCCGERTQLPPDYGIRLSRAPRMLHNPELLWRGLPCASSGRNGMCTTCPLSNAYETGPALLVTVGETYYATPEDFAKESRQMGISRRIPQVPQGFVVGETWVLLAHSKAISKVEMQDRDPETGQLYMEPKPVTVYSAGVFSMFRPRRIEIVVDGTEPDEKIDDMLKRGLTPVLVHNPDKAKQDEAALGGDDAGDMDEVEAVDE